MSDVPHNPGMALDLAWLEQVRVNLPAVKRRAETFGTRRTVKQQWQVRMTNDAPYTWSNCNVLPGCLVAEGRDMHRPDHSVWGRHRCEHQQALLKGCQAN